MDFIPRNDLGPQKTFNSNISHALESMLEGMNRNTGDFEPSGNSTSPPFAGYRLFRIILDVYLASIICLLGFLANSLTIAILWSDHDKKSTTNWLLQTLAVVDMVYLFACLFIQPLKTAWDVTDWLSVDSRKLFTLLQPYIWALASMAQMATVWMVLLVTVDRYIAICHPLKSKIRTIQRARGAVAFVVVLAIVYNIPLMMEGVSVEELTTDEGLVNSPPEARMTRIRVFYFLVYKSVCFFVFRSIGPLVALLTLNFKLVRALGEMRRRHRYLSSSSRQRENVTLALVVVVSVFIVCELPDVCLRLVVTLWEWVPSIELNIYVTYRLVNPVTNMLLTINSSVNFLIYCLIGKKFRRILFRLCLLRRRTTNSDARLNLSHCPSAKTYELAEV